MYGVCPGVSGLLIRESGSVTIKRNAIVTSGRGGTGGSGGSSFTSYLAAVRVHLASLWIVPHLCRSGRRG
jgi:hypothetical protein